MKESRVQRRLKELAQATDEQRAGLVGISVTKWRTLLRAEKREMLERAIRKEK